MKPTLLYPAVTGLAVAMLGFLGALHAANAVLIAILGMVTGAAVGYVLHRTLLHNRTLAAEVANKACELETQYAELQFERAAIEETAAENISLAEDLYLAREEAENNARFLNVVMNNICQAIAVFSKDGTLIKWNEQLGDILGIPIDQLEQGMAADAFDCLVADNSAPRPDDGFEMMEIDIEPTESSTAPADCECRLNDGRVLSVRRTAMPDGGFVKTFTDITDRKKAEEVIRRMAHHDHLTGLANRARFNQEIEHAVTGSRRGDGRLALAMIDLDKFKPINDRFGHLAGDKLLVAIADILKANIRNSDLAARFGGDEFAILLSNVESVDHAVSIIRRISEALSPPLTIDGHAMNVGASIGIALYPDHATTATGLISAADDALYTVKDSGRGDIAVSKIHSLESHRAAGQKAG